MIPSWGVLARTTVRCDKMYFATLIESKDLASSVPSSLPPPPYGGRVPTPPLSTLRAASSAGISGRPLHPPLGIPSTPPNHNRISHRSLSRLVSYTFILQTLSTFIHLLLYSLQTSPLIFSISPRTEGTPDCAHHPRRRLSPSAGPRPFAWLPSRRRLPVQIAHLHSIGHRQSPLATRP